jgi:hypothetical protein
MWDLLLAFMIPQTKYRQKQACNVIDLLELRPRFPDLQSVQNTVSCSNMYIHSTNFAGLL